MVRLTGFEPVTTHLEGGCSIQLSYRRIKKSLSALNYYLTLLLDTVYHRI